MFVFLWTFLLRDIFSDAERVQIPNFVNLLYDDVINSQEYKKLYKFDIKYVVDPEKVDGLIISQKPEADRSIMISPEGVHIELTVSTGIILSKVPDVVSKQYQEATLELQRAGFVVDLIFEASESKKEDFVIKTSPAAGEELSSGSTVYITVSSGPSKKEVTMPNLVGMMEQKAIERIKSVNLVYVDTTYLYSEFDAGTVIKQSQPAYEQIEEYCKIYLWVSLGPKPDTP
jgi:serine/threonine-protein kinase